MHIARTIGLDVLHWVECEKNCPGPVDKSSCRDWALMHTAMTGHQTYSVRRIMEAIGTSNDEVPAQRGPSGLGWPAFADQGWISGTAGVDDDRP